MHWTLVTSSVPEHFLATISQDPRVSKSNRLHLVIYGCFSIHKSVAYSIEIYIPVKLTVNFPLETLEPPNGYFLGIQLGSSVTNRWSSSLRAFKSWPFRRTKIWSGHQQRCRRGGGRRQYTCLAPPQHKGGIPSTLSLWNATSNCISTCGILGRKT